MAEVKSFYSKDEYDKLCLSMGYKPDHVVSIRINPTGMYVTYVDAYAGTTANGLPPLATQAHEIRK